MPAIFQLDSPDDFMWYKQGLNNQDHYDYVHVGTPTHYPCRVYSMPAAVFGTQPVVSGYSHVFIYQVQKTCPHCGHITWAWPEDLKSVRFTE